MTENRKIRVLLIGDSSLYMQNIANAICLNTDINTIATVQNDENCTEKTINLKPDVIIIEIQKPISKRIDTISQIMQKIPTPIIAITTLADESIRKILDIGIMDIISIPEDFNLFIKELSKKTIIASRIHVIRRLSFPQSFTKHKNENFKIITIGASTGGPTAISKLLAKLPENLPAAILISQHTSKGCIHSLIDFFQKSCHPKIQLAHNEMSIEPGDIIIAPDDAHLKVIADRKIQIVTDQEGAYNYTPSIDLMMITAANCFKDRVIGVIMTGMGNDGVNGIKEIKEAGGYTIAQDETTSAIFGMNKLAIDSGFVDRISPLNEIPNIIIDLLNSNNDIQY